MARPETAATQLGVVESTNVMQEPTENARVLVIEDQHFESEKVAEVLHRDNDTVIPVESGIRAMEYVSQYEFDLIVVSLNLAAEDGLRLCSHLRSNEKTRSTPILMIGTEGDMPRIAHGLEIGAHDYILRPSIAMNCWPAPARKSVAAGFRRGCVRITKSRFPWR